MIDILLQQILDVLIANLSEINTLLDYLVDETGGEG